MSASGECAWVDTKACKHTYVCAKDKGLFKQKIEYSIGDNKYSKFQDNAKNSKRIQ